MRIQLFIFLCILSIQLFPQQVRIDSLNKVLKTAKEDTNKINALTSLADELKSLHPEQSIAFAQQAIALAGQLNYPKGIAVGYLLLGAATSIAGKNQDALIILEKAAVLCEKAGDKKNYARAIHNIGVVYFNLGHFNEALKRQLLCLKLRKETGDERIISNSFNSIGNVYEMLGNYTDALNMHHSALEIRLRLKDSSGIASSYNNIGNIYTDIGNYTEALNNHFSSLQLQIKLNNKMGIASSYNNIGNVYNVWGNYSQALYYFFEALKIQKLIGDVNSLTNSYGNIAMIYNAQGNYPESLKMHLAALKTAEETGNKSGVANSYNNIGNIYQNQGNYNEALKNYSLSLKLNTATGERSRTSESFESIGAVYQLMGKYGLALENHLAALKIRKEMGEQAGLASSYTSIGWVYYSTGNYSKALEYERISVKITMEIGDKPGLANTCNKMGDVYMKLKNTKEAQAAYSKSLTLSRELGNKALIMDNYNGLSELYKGKGDYAKAYEYFKLRIVYRDSLINEDNTKKTVQLQMQYDFDKKTAADSIRNVEQKRLKDTEIALRTADLQRSRMQFWFVVVGLLIVAVALVLVVNRFRITSQQKKIIEQQNEQIVESINYSKQIQDALLPDTDEMKKHFPGLLIHNLPRDIVSGDFYWFRQSGDYSLLACVDCTGHGVPGAFMSTLGSLLLDKIVSTGILNTAEILNRLNEEIIRILHQHVGGGIQDGMDLSVCLINHKEKNILFSGARNGVIVVRNGEAKRFKADLLPVGGNYMKNGKLLERNFKSQELPVQAGDWLYMYTDGFVEQTGGASPGSPMNYEQFEQQLISVSTNEEPAIKSDKLKKALDHWRGENERTDDVLIIGIRI